MAVYYIVLNVRYLYPGPNIATLEYLNNGAASADVLACDMGNLRTVSTYLGPSGAVALKVISIPILQVCHMSIRG